MKSDNLLLFLSSLQISMYIFSFEGFSTFAFSPCERQKYESLVSHFWTTSHATLLAPYVLEKYELSRHSVSGATTSSSGRSIEAMRSVLLLFRSTPNEPDKAARRHRGARLRNATMARLSGGVGGAVPTLAAPTVQVSSSKSAERRSARVQVQKRRRWLSANSVNRHVKGARLSSLAVQLPPVVLATRIRVASRVPERLLPPAFTLTNLLTMNVRQAPYTKMSARSSVAATKGYNPIELFDVGWPVAKELQNRAAEHCSIWYVFDPLVDSRTLASETKWLAACVTTTSRFFFVSTESWVATLCRDYIWRTACCFGALVKGRVSQHLPTALQVTCGNSNLFKLFRIGTAANQWLWVCRCLRFPQQESHLWSGRRLCSFVCLNVMIRSTGLLLLDWTTPPVLVKRATPRLPRVQQVGCHGCWCFAQWIFCRVQWDVSGMLWYSLRPATQMSLGTSVGLEQFENSNFNWVLGRNLLRVPPTWHKTQVRTVACWLWEKQNWQARSYQSCLLRTVSEDACIHTRANTKKRKSGLRGEERRGDGGWGKDARTPATVDRRNWREEEMR